MQELFQSTLLHLMYSITHSMQLTVSDFAMPEIFMEDLPTLQRMFSSRELLLLKVELQHLQLLPVQQLSIIHSRHLQKQVSTL